ncbi:MAG: hypothetical protein ACXAEB_11840 [Candidatus Thorarchaeota archaeon]|jgi:hypothetical protein
MFENRRDVALAIVVGVFLFLSDLIFGWMTFFTGRIPVIFIMAIIIGIIAGEVGDGAVSTLLAWLIGILVATLLTPIILAEFWEPDSSLITMPITIAIWSLRGTFAFEYEGSWIGGIALAALVLFVAIIATPIYYVFSLIIGGIGGYIGRVLRDRYATRTPASEPVAPLEPPPQ